MYPQSYQSYQTSHYSTLNPSLAYIHQNIQTWCRWCEKPLKGRSDKRYCNIHCKNEWHQWIRKHGMKGPIIAIINANCRVIQSFLDHGIKAVTYDELIQAGLRPEYHTSDWTSPQNVHFKFCFHFGWSVPENSSDPIHLLERKIPDPTE